MQYMHNYVRDNGDGSFTWVLVFFSWSRMRHVYRYMEVK
jgi:hypothetical protein